jgi:hypothetical protein
VLTDLGERPIDPALGDALVRYWLTSGMQLGPAMGNDIGLYAAALRRHVARYSGPGLTLLRGQLARHHLARRYGLSWTPDVKVAQMLAVRHGAGEGDAVVLRADVRSDAIIIDLREYPLAIARREPQLLVDPRMLGEIEVVETVHDGWAAR